MSLRYRGDARRRRYGAALLGGTRAVAARGRPCGWAPGATTRPTSSVAATAQQSRTFVPDVRVAAVRASDSKITVTLPATTTAFEAANIFARTSGYIEKRYVDIGDQVKAGDLLAEITAPELDHQITQAKATLAQNQATLQQTQASRDLAQVTNARDSKLVKQGWLTLQQGDNDRLTLQAQQGRGRSGSVEYCRPGSPDSHTRAGEGLPARRGAVRRRHHTAQHRQRQPGDSPGSTFMFTLMHSDVIRTQVFVPQDEAFGLGPGVDAVVRVPEIPDRTFPGKVTRIASALQPGSRTLLTEIDVPNPDWRAQPRNLLHRRAVYPAQDAVDDHTRRRRRIRSKWPACRASSENGSVHLQKITIARDFGTEVEVHDGVKPGDQVVLNPMVNLAEGDKVCGAENIDEAGR